MKVDEQLVDKVAELAKLEFKGEQKDAIIQEFQKMLNFVDKLNEIDTEGVEPLIHVTDRINAFREDEAQNSVTHQDALKNAPEADSDYFKVPKVLKG